MVIVSNDLCVHVIKKVNNENKKDKRQTKTVKVYYLKQNNKKLLTKLNKYDIVLL